MDIDLMINAGIPIGLLIITFISGRIIEKNHRNHLEDQERFLKDIIIVSDRNIPFTDSKTVGFVQGSVVIGQDYFIAFAASLRGLIGGRVRSYEGLYDRARREAIIRMKQSAKNKGANMVFNIKFNSMNVASLTGKRGVVGVEIVAYGTAVKRQ
jgi:uncharacterized protein YbjQ (UPF0145 family)